MLSVPLHILLHALQQHYQLVKFFDSDNILYLFTSMPHTVNMDEWMDGWTTWQN